MSREKRQGEVQPIYSALIGGLMASFVAVVVFTWLYNNDSGSGHPSAMLPPVLAGLAAAGLFMVIGMIAAEHMPWLSGGLLFASGFTALWSVALSFTVEPRWVVVLALGVGIGMGIALGRWRFGSGDRDSASDSLPAAGA